MGTRRDKPLGALLDVLVPERCAVCGRGEVLLCNACRTGLPAIAPPVCERCGAPTAWPVTRCAECAGRRLAFASARAALLYERSTRALVGAWKERGSRRLTPVLAGIVTERVRRPEVDVLTFVPGDRDRTRRRGHNAPEALARELAEGWELPLAPLLLRTAATPRQAGLDRAARRSNVRGSFAAAGRVPRRVALVDDVFTTGATVGAAATELRRAGARAVHVVALARALRR